MPGLFEGAAGDAAIPLLALHFEQGVEQVHDAYAFGPLLDEALLQRFHAGDADAARQLGAVPTQVQGIAGVRFAVWAPNARRVAVVGDFNGWDGRRHPMRLRHTAGVWELFLPGAGRCPLQIPHRRRRRPGDARQVRSDGALGRAATGDRIAGAFGCADAVAR